MLRLHPKLFRKFFSIQLNGTKHFSSSTQKSSKLKATLLLGTGAIAVTSITLAYAKYDKKFADELIAYAPFIKSFLEDAPISSNVKKDDIYEFPKKKTPKSVENENSISAQKQQQKITDESKSEIATSTPKLIEKKEEKSPLMPEVQIVTTPFESKPRTTEDDLQKEVQNLQLKAANPNVMEDEFRGQLKRLLYAFNEFYEEKRILYETENKRNHEVEMKNYLIQERASMSEEYEKSIKKLKQMEKLLEIRDQLDKQEKASKKLWLLSQTLSKLLEHNRTLSNEAKPINIQEKIEIIRKVINENFSNEPLIQVAVKTLPENVMKNGVYSEEDLIRRYHNLHKICNRVALVDKEYTNIFGYLKSYAYSYIRPLLQIEFELGPKPIRCKQIPSEEFEGKIDIDPNEWDAYDILERVKFCVENRNLEMAIRYANLLNGEPYSAAKDWIKDAREHLEVKQVMELLQSKIASINLHQLSFSS